jgi:hypothetical protein
MQKQESRRQNAECRRQKKIESRRQNAECRRQNAECRMRNKIYGVYVTAYCFLHSAFWLVLTAFCEKEGKR